MDLTGPTSEVNDCGNACITPERPIGDYYEYCINCRHGTCITDDALSNFKSTVDAEGREFQALVDKVERVEYSVSTITSAFLQQKRALEKELLSLDLAFSAVAKEKEDSEALQTDLLRRAQKHVTQRNFLRRFAGQQQLQLVSHFGPRNYGKAARGDYRSDDTLFRPVVMEAGGSESKHVESVEETSFTTQFTSHSAPQSKSTRRGPLKRSPSVQSPHAGNRRSSSTSRRGTCHPPSRNESVSVASDASGRSRIRDDGLAEGVWGDEGNGGMEEVLRLMRLRKARRRRERLGDVGEPLRDESTRRKSSPTGKKSHNDSGPSILHRGDAKTPLGQQEGFPHQPVRRQKNADQRLRDTTANALSALDAADHAAEIRSAEVDLLIRRLDNSSTASRSKDVLAWYAAKLADSAQIEKSRAEDAHRVKVLEEAEDARVRAEEDVLLRRSERDRLLFGSASSDSALQSGTSSSARPTGGTPLIPAPVPPNKQRSIFDNPKYRMAAMRAMSEQTRLLK